MTLSNEGETPCTERAAAIKASRQTSLKCVSEQVQEGRDNEKKRQIILCPFLAGFTQGLELLYQYISQSCQQTWEAAGLYKDHKPRLRDESLKRIQCCSQLMIFPILYLLLEHVSTESKLLPAL